jgi:hypothetical protein
MGEVVQVELEVEEAYFLQHPISHQNQLGHIYGSTDLAFQLSLSKGFLDVADQEFQRWYKPPDLSVESIPNRKSKILKPPDLSVGSI